MEEEINSRQAPHDLQPCETCNSFICSASCIRFVSHLVLLLTLLHPLFGKFCCVTVGYKLCVLMNSRNWKARARAHTHLKKKNYWHKWKYLQRLHVLFLNKAITKCCLEFGFPWKTYYNSTVIKRKMMGLEVMGSLHDTGAPKYLWKQKNPAVFYAFWGDTSVFVSMRGKLCS